MKPNQIYCGDNLPIVKPWPTACIDGIITDPPYELGFMSKKWDSSGIAYSIPLWKSLLRITKPGGILLCFGGTRTHHRIACAIEDAGWEIRDCMMWLYGSGFPKSHNISKAIDKSAGAKRPVIGTANKPKFGNKCGFGMGGCFKNRESTSGHIVEYTVANTDLAQQWDGYGTALKPAWEPIIVAMKPLDGTFAHNAEKHSVAGLNIDGGRIGTQTRKNPEAGFIRRGRTDEEVFGSADKNKPDTSPHEVQGRWPANLILDEEAGAMLDEQSGITKSSGGSGKASMGALGKSKYGKYALNIQGANIGGLGDVGGASRFFYCAKTGKKERNLGCEDKNNHPTVKPLSLMKYLCTLLKMPSANQVILDPFLGSGTTGMACKSLGINFVGIEREPEYCEIALRRISVAEGTHPITLHTDNPLAEVPKPIPPNDEHRKRIIAEACANLRRTR